MANTTLGAPKFDPIPPGESRTSHTRDFAITVRKGCPNDSYNFGLEITSGDVLFWYDTLSFLTTDVEDEQGDLPTVFALEQNYPNPFNPATTINYSIPAVETGHAPSLQHVNLVIYDLLGREVATLVNEQQRPGSYTVNFDASGFSSGVYFYKLTAGQFTESKKMILLR